MLHQSIHRLPFHSGRLDPTAITSICATCTCRCGALFQQAGRHRSYASKRRAPSTLRKASRDETIALTPEQARRRRTYVKQEQREFYNLLRFVHKSGFLSSPDEAINFLNDFDELAKKHTGRPTVDPGDLNAICERHGMSEMDGYFLGRLLAKESEQDARVRGKKLLLSLSRAGSVEATVFVVANALVQAKKKPALLNSSEIAYSRAHLDVVADNALDFRAMVLQGKIAVTLGDPEKAIMLWTRAMDSAVAAAKAAEKDKREGRRLDMPAQWAQTHADHMELSSPWIELMMIHYERSRHGRKDEMHLCRRAMNTGCELDDPTSHFYAATFTKRIDEHGNHIVTSSWLYHMLKAASSGHQKACHEIAVFYAQSGWKYIEDEPPDYIKPTPFDSYPAPSVLSSLSAKLSVLFGIKEATQPDPKDTMFQSAIFPSTAVDRFRVAMSWLENPIYYYYAPSFLFKAKMYMQETLWAGADAPRSALKLSSKRYTYASKADHDANKRITPNNDEQASAPADPPNPLYSLDEARLALREVFYAYEANIHVERFRSSWKRMRQLVYGGTDEDKYLLEQSKNLPSRLRKWFSYPVVREMYEDDLEALYGEAKGICDEMGWDMYDEEGGLLYKAKRRKTATQQEEDVAVAASG